MTKEIIITDTKVKKLGTPITIGELKKIIDKYPGNTSFGFRDQPLQDLVEVDHSGLGM